MNKNLLSLPIISILIMTPLALSQDPGNSDYKEQINTDEDAIVGKFAEEALKLEHGAEKALKAEWARDKKRFSDKPKPSTETLKEAPSVESIKADLQAREEIAAEIENPLSE